MTVDRWIMNRLDDNFVIRDWETDKKLYDARTTVYEPSSAIMNSIIVEEYSENGLTILMI